MVTKKIIIIAVLLVAVILLVGAIVGSMTKSVDYERIEITQNGTSIEVPVEQAKYEGEMNGTGAKLWSFKQGSLMTFNSEEAIDARGLNGLGGAVGVKTIEDMVLTHFEKSEQIDGFTVYTIDGQKMGIEGRGEMYCIITGNNTTHDNIVIVTDNKDITIHMAKSIQYKALKKTAKDNTTSDDSVTSSESGDKNTNSVSGAQNAASESQNAKNDKSSSSQTPEEEPWESYEDGASSDGFVPGHEPEGSSAETETTTDK